MKIFGKKCLTILPLILNFWNIANMISRTFTGKPSIIKNFKILQTFLRRFIVVIFVRCDFLHLICGSNSTVLSSAIAFIWKNKAHWNIAECTQNRKLIKWNCELSTVENLIKNLMKPIMFSVERFWGLICKSWTIKSFLRTDKKSVFLLRIWETGQILLKLKSDQFQSKSSKKIKICTFAQFFQIFTSDITIIFWRILNFDQVSDCSTSIYVKSVFSWWLASWLNKSCFLLFGRRCVKNCLRFSAFFLITYDS